MTSKFLLDTNVISEPLRPQPNQGILKNMQQHQNEIAITTINWHELWFGCHRLPESKKRRAIKSYLDEIIYPHIPILPYDELAAEWHAVERARLTKIGKTPSFADGQIAAIAYINKMTLITQNLTDFLNFQDVQVLNWGE